MNTPKPAPENPNALTVEMYERWLTEKCGVEIEDLEILRKGDESIANMFEGGIDESKFAIFYEAQAEIINNKTGLTLQPVTMQEIIDKAAQAAGKAEHTQTGKSQIYDNFPGGAGKTAGPADQEEPAAQPAGQARPDAPGKTEHGEPAGPVAGEGPGNDAEEKEPGEKAQEEPGEDTESPDGAPAETAPKKNVRYIIGAVAAAALAAGGYQLYQSRQNDTEPDPAETQLPAPSPSPAPSPASSAPANNGNTRLTGCKPDAAQMPWKPFTVTCTDEKGFPYATYRTQKRIEEIGRWGSNVEIVVDLVKPDQPEIVANKTKLPEQIKLNCTNYSIPENCTVKKSGEK